MKIHLRWVSVRVLWKYQPGTMCEISKKKLLKKKIRTFLTFGINNIDLFQEKLCAVRKTTKNSVSPCGAIFHLYEVSRSQHLMQFCHRGQLCIINAACLTFGRFGLLVGSRVSTSAAATKVILTPQSQQC